MQVHRIPFSGMPTKFDGLVLRLKEAEAELNALRKEAAFLGAELQAGFSADPGNIYLSLWLSTFK